MYVGVTTAREVAETNLEVHCYYLTAWSVRMWRYGPGGGGASLTERFVVDVGVDISIGVDSSVEKSKCQICLHACMAVEVDSNGSSDKHGVD